MGELMVIPKPPRVSNLIPLKEVVYDVRAKNGTWCNHGFHCMNSPKCTCNAVDFHEIERRWGPFKWFAVVEEFDIVTQEKRMAELHPKWSRKMCRNPRYWQKGVKKRLLLKAMNETGFSEPILAVPEAHGINVVLTMAKVGIKFEWGLGAKTILKVMFIGKKTT